MDRMMEKRICGISAGIWVYIILISLSCGLISFLTPYQCDDLYFKLRYEAFPDIRDYITYSYMTKNGRLADLSTYFMISMVPPWLFSLLCGVMVALSCRYMVLLMQINRDRTSGAMQIIALSIYILFLPWHDLMFTRACSLNYIFTSGLIMPCIYYFIHRDVSETKIKKMLLSMLSLVASMMHEGFSVPVLVGFIVYVILNKGITKTQLCMLIAFAIGTMLPLMSPGIWGRISEQASTSASDVIVVEKLYGLFYSLLRFNGFMVMLWIMTIIVAVGIKNQTKEQRLMMIYLSSTIIVSVLISGFSGNVARSYWLSNILTIVLFTYLILSGREKNAWQKIKRIIVTLFCLIVIVHMGYSIYWQAMLRKEFEDVKHKFIQSENGIVYCDLMTVPSICFGKPLEDQFCRWWLLHPFSLFYGNDDKKLCVVPHELKTYEPEAKDCVSDSLSMYKTEGGHIIMTHPPEKLIPYCQLCFGLKNGNKKIVYMDLIEYQNINGQTYYYCSPYNLRRQEMADIERVFVGEGLESDNLQLLLDKI